MNYFSSAVLFLGLCNFAVAGVYELTFRRAAAASDRKQCETFVEETAKTLASQSGAKIIDFGCNEDEFSVRALDAVITYEAPARLDITSTNSTSTYSGALYANLADCNDALEKQEVLFTKVTRLPVLTSYCMLDVGIGRRWETRIDGLGISEMKPENAAVTLWGKITDFKSIAADYSTAAPAYGITVSEVGMDGGGFGRHIVVRFYAKTYFSIKDYNDMKFDNISTCETAAATTKKFLEGTDKPVVSFCEQVSGGATLHVTNFADTLKPVNVFKAIQLSKQYASIADCHKGLTALPTVSDAYGVVCAGVGKNVRAFLFTRP